MTRSLTFATSTPAKRADLSNPKREELRGVRIRMREPQSGPSGRRAGAGNGMNVRNVARSDALEDHRDRGLRDPVEDARSLAPIVDDPFGSQAPQLLADGGLADARCHDQLRHVPLGSLEEVEDPQAEWVAKHTDHPRRAVEGRGIDLGDIPDRLSHQTGTLPERTGWIDRRVCDQTAAPRRPG